MSALLLYLAAAVCGTSAWAAGPKMHFDIPAGDAATALNRFFSQTHALGLFSVTAVQGLKTNAVSGDFEVSEALRLMLEGTGIEFRVENNSYTITPKQAEPPVLTAQNPASTGAALDARRDAIDVLKAFGDEHKLQEVVVTGTLIHGVLDIMSPLTFVTHREMKKTAYATVQDALQSLPVNVGGAPSEDFSSSGNFSRGVGVNLRGLGAGATLVLVNGHRQPFSGTDADFVDVSSIPWSAVERIEVLPDGASALYGSDAIAGVVNVIMRDDLDGAETQARLGSAGGGADERLISQLFGTHWASGNVLLSYQYSERTALAAAERAYAANTDKRSLGGTDHRSVNSNPGNILDPATLLPLYGIPPGQDGTALTAADLLPNAINLQNRYASLQLLPERKTHSLFFSGHQELNDRIELFGDARYSRRHVTQQLQATDTMILVPATNPFFVSPTPGAPFVVVGYSFLDDLGPLELSANTQSFEGTFGATASVGDSWRLTLSGSVGREHMDYVVANQVDLLALGSALADPNPATAFNPFGDGSHNNPATLDAIRLVQRPTIVSTVDTANFTADGTLLDLPTGAVKLAVGAEWRDEQLARSIFASSSFGRKVASTFAELSVPLLGDPENERATPRLELSLAGRYERYSDFGATSNPKIGLRWIPTDSIKLRTSWGTSFRAPKLVDLYDTSQNHAGIAQLPDPRSALGASIVLVRQGNSPDLTDERATTWTAGLDILPQSIPGLQFSLTYYAINYKDRILIPGLGSPLDILLQEGQWGEAITRNPSQAEVNSICESEAYHESVAQCESTPFAAIVDYRARNLATTRVKGADFKLDRMWDTRLGSLAFGLNGGYIFSFEQAASDMSPMVDLVNTVGNPLALRLRGTAEWYEHAFDEAGFGVNLTVDHTGAYRDTEAQMLRDVNGLTTVDVRVSYRTAPGPALMNDIEFGLNAVNLFDHAPPFVDREAGYDPVNTDPYGRVVSVSIQKNW